MHIEIFVFDMPDGTPGMNNFPVPEEKKKRYAKGLVLREQLQINKDKCAIMMETLWSTKILPYRWWLI